MLYFFPKFIPWQILNTAFSSEISCSFSGHVTTKIFNRSTVYLFVKYGKILNAAVKKMLEAVEMSCLRVMCCADLMQRILSVKIERQCGVTKGIIQRAEKRLLRDRKSVV